MQSKASILLSILVMSIIPANVSANADIDNTDNVRIPLHFEPNLGQFNDDIRFVGRGNGYTLLLKDDSITLALNNKTIEMSIIDADADIIGLDRLSSKSNYYLSDDWYADIPNYAKVMYDDVYNGIDLVFYESNNSLKYDFILEPYADYNSIKLKFDDASIVDNRLLIDGIVHEEPVIYQIVDGKKVFIDGKYVIDDNIIRFDISNYDKSRELVIDPVIDIEWSTYLGGRGGDYGEDIAVDSNGVYVTGYTQSNDFPTKDAYDDSFNGRFFFADAFVTKFNHDGTLVWSTYLGGSDGDYGYGIAVDSNGVYVTGGTYSPDFPTMNAYDDSNNGYEDAFVTKFNHNGTLAWSTYLGGSGNDDGFSIAVDSRGVYVTGMTFSNNFPTKDAYDNTLDGYVDAFVTKFNHGGALVWSTYLGGNYDDDGRGIAVNNSGVYVTGGTHSPDFPTENANDDTLEFNDAFVTKFNHGGALVWSTYLGGNGNDGGEDIAVDSNGVYVTGGTGSTDFPTMNAYDNSRNGYSDAFVTKFNHGGTLAWSTYLGGSSGDGGEDIAVDSSGVYVTGITHSSDFPTKNAYDNSYNGWADAFVIKFNHNGALAWSTYLGGSKDDIVSSIAVNSSGVYVTGRTRTNDFPTMNVDDDGYNGGYSDAFVTKIGEEGLVVIKWGPERVSPGDTFTYGISIRNIEDEDINNVSIIDQLPDEVEYLSSTDGAYDATTRRVSWNIDIPAGGILELFITVTVHWGLAGGTEIVNSVTVTFDSQEISDTHTSIVTTAHDPNIKYGREGYVRAGERLTYTVEFENTGSGRAHGVYITDRLDDDLDEDTLDIGQGGTYDSTSRTIRWDIGTLEANEGGYVQFSVDVRSDAEDGTEIVNYAIVHFPSVPEETRTNPVVSIVGLPVDLKVMQGNKVLGEAPGEEGVLGVDIDCIGAIKYASANDFECSLIDINNDVIDSNSTTDTIDCSTVGYTSDYTCFRVTFPADDFTQGRYRFNATFTENGNVIDIQGPDFRVASFLVLPETAIGAIAVFASIFGAFIVYSMRRR